MSDKVIADIAEGVTKGTLSWTGEQVSQIVKKLKSGKSGILNNLSQSFNSLKIQRNSSEWKLYSQYIKDPKLRKLTNFGLQLRSYTKDKTQLESLREKIRKRYELKGLHIAEFVASKILSKFIASMIDANKPSKQMSSEIEQMLNNVEQDVSFIHSGTNSNTTIENVIRILNASSPQLHILSSKGRVNNNCKNMVVSISKKVKGYKVEEYSDEDEYAVFFKKL